MTVPMENGEVMVKMSVFPNGTVHDEKSQTDWGETTDHSQDVPGAIPGGGWKEGDIDDAASKPNLWE